MKLYDQVTEEIRSLLPATPDIKAEYRPELCAPEGDKNAILFGGETAYELGGGGKPAVSCVLFGAVPSGNDEVLVYGRDLRELTEDAPFAHITLIRLKDGDETALRYERLKEIGFTLCRLYPMGFHIRVSPSSCREQARVANAALAASPPLSLVNVGCSLIRLLKEDKDVDCVRTVFIAGTDVDYTALAEKARRAKAITDTVQRTLQFNTLDCDSCRMKPVCDEIDGLRELHFRKEQEKRK